MTIEWTDQALKNARAAIVLTGGNINNPHVLRAALTAAAEAQGLTGTQQTERRCATCSFWRERPKEPGYGDCRRYPPKLTVGYEPEGRWTTSIDQHVPCTAADDFCGEYKPERQP